MSLLDEVKQRVDIVQVVGRYVDLDTRSRVPKALCPFHSERTPSFVVYPDTGTWRCFGGCATGGDAIAFVMKKENIPFGDAVNRLADELGIQRQPQAGAVTQDGAAGRLNTTDLYEANEVAGRYFRARLKSPDGEAARMYLAARGISMEAAERRGLGLAPTGLETLAAHLKTHAVDGRAARDAGLVTHAQDGSWRDMFRGRLTVEIRDERGRLCGFGARSLDGAEPKYLNTAKSETFDKGRLLYGLNWALDTVRATGRAVVVEGYMDAITAHEHGFTDVVACMGTAITVDQLQLIERHVRGQNRPGAAILCLDTDAAGQQATLRELADVGAQYSAGGRTDGAGQRQGKRTTLHIAVPPGGKDPDEVIRTDPAAWKQSLDKAVPFVQFMIEATASRLDTSSPDGKTQLFEALRPVIMSIDNPYEQDRYMTMLARKMNASEESVKSLMTRSATAVSNRPGVQQATARRRAPRGEKIASAQVGAALAAGEDALEEYFLALTLTHADLREYALAARSEHFFDTANREIFARCSESANFGLREAPTGDPLADKIERFKARVLPPSDHLQRVESMNQCVRRLRERYLRRLKTLESKTFSELDGSGPESREDLIQRSLESNSGLRQVFTGKS